MADGRAREQLRQEREAFDRSCRHSEAWFRLRLSLGYLGLGITLAITGTAAWVLFHPEACGPLPVGASAVAVSTQTLGLGYAIVRMVLLQPQVASLTSATVASRAAPTTRRKSFTAAIAAAPTTIPAA
ncbi:hypothetical protein [Sphingomonas sp. PP-CE-1G-424]|uniref:hypothetical protein n=1 Tax=Sphingomonas sp. PP-CE-1G-424 TaxID=2135658 RepID=UPI0010553D09|nr:hypothetical protein [Sphingomonas sp. PP-CE-1G-424]TCP67367.1 hypothetical protein C8J43_1037 [Sphingomonas sp. PP-CE-1G-424]